MKRGNSTRGPRCRGKQKFYCPSCRLENCGKCKLCLTPSLHQSCVNKPIQKCITYLRHNRSTLIDSQGGPSSSITARQYSSNISQVSTTSNRVVPMEVTIPSSAMSNAAGAASSTRATPMFATSNVITQAAAPLPIAQSEPSASAPATSRFPITTASVARAVGTFTPTRANPASCAATAQGSFAAVFPMTPTSSLETTANAGTINISPVQKELQDILSSLAMTLKDTSSSFDNLSRRLQNINQPLQNPMPTQVGPSSMITVQEKTPETKKLPFSRKQPIATRAKPKINTPPLATQLKILPKVKSRIPQKTQNISPQKVTSMPQTAPNITMPPVAMATTSSTSHGRAPPIPSTNSQSTTMQQATTSEISLKRMMREAILNTKVNLHITKCGISGPPGTGKTHFRKLLLGKKRPMVRKSTMVSTKADEITKGDLVVNSMSQQQTNHTRWAVLDDEPWLRLLTNTIFEHLKKKNSNINDLDIDFEDITCNFSDFSIEIYCKLYRILQETKGKRKVKRDTLDKIHLIYLVDTGGQPQFQEILPHFVQSSVHFIVHNLSQGLLECPQFQYTVDGWDYTIPEDLKTSNISLIEQSVRSACSSIHMDTWNKGRPHVAIIGTFKDQCNPERINQMLQEKSTEIKKTLKPYMECKHAMKCNMMECSKDRAIYPIDASQRGWDVNGPIVEKIRSEINSFGETNNAKVPLGYFIFLQNLKHACSRRHYVSIAECKKIAAEGFIVLNDEEIQEALRLFSDVNLIFYFPEISNVSHLVFMNPTFFYKKITDIIVKSFVSSRATSPQNEFRDTGIFTADILSTLSFDSEFTEGMFLSILKDLYIISEIDNSYFMPCVLKLEDTASLSHECQSQLQVVINTMNMNHIGGPLIISFGDRISPRGLFCAMIVILSKYFGWKLNTDNSTIRRRNVIEFCVYFSSQLGPSIYIGTAVIFDKVTHLEVYTTCPSSCCFEVRSAIVWSLSKACRSLKYRLADFGVEQGFRCDLCIDANHRHHHTIVSKNTKMNLVHKCSYNSRMHGIILSPHQKVWFQSNSTDSFTREAAIPDITVIAENLIPKTNKWYMIGLKLQLSINDLEKIIVDNDNEDTRFLKVLEKWSRNGDPSFSWNTIRDVLISSLVQENVLAREIEEKYIN